MYRKRLGPCPADSKCSVDTGYDRYPHSIISIIRRSHCSLLGSPLLAPHSPTRALCSLTMTMTLVLIQNLAVETILLPHVGAC